jgi:hypothetical protein
MNGDRHPHRDLRRGNIEAGPPPHDAFREQAFVGSIRFGEGKAAGLWLARLCCVGPPHDIPPLPAAVVGRELVAYSFG